MRGRGTKGGADKTPGQLVAEAETNAIKLAVEVGAGRLRLAGLGLGATALSVVTAGSLAAILGYFRPPGLAQQDAQNLAVLGLLFGGGGVVLLAHRFLAVWTGMAHAALSLRRLRGAIDDERRAAA